MKRRELFGSFLSPVKSALLALKVSGKPAVPDTLDSSFVRVSFDHLVGAGEQRRWHVEAERLGGLEVDHQLVLGRLPAPAGRPASRP